MSSLASHLFEPSLLTHRLSEPRELPPSKSEKLCLLKLELQGRCWMRRRHLSLSALGDVISSLKKKSNHIPYRQEILKIGL